MPELWDRAERQLKERKRIRSKPLNDSYDLKSFKKMMIDERYKTRRKMKERQKENLGPKTKQTTLFSTDH